MQDKVTQYTIILRGLGRISLAWLIGPSAFISVASSIEGVKVLWAVEVK